MKNVLPILAVCFVLSSCKTTARAVPRFDLCAEKQMVADVKKMTIKGIGDLVTPPTENDVRTLVKPLSKNFRLDDGQCQGFTEQVRDASKAIVRKRANEISPTLQKICSGVPDPEIRDVSLLAAMQEERMGAKEALIILNEPTTECLAN